jgi:hypothetical protein
VAPAILSRRAIVIVVVVGSGGGGGKRKVQVTHCEVQVTQREVWR